MRVDREILVRTILKNNHACQFRNKNKNNNSFNVKSSLFIVDRHHL